MKVRMSVARCCCCEHKELTYTDDFSGLVLDSDWNVINAGFTVNTLNQRAKAVLSISGLPPKIARLTNFKSSNTGIVQQATVYWIDTTPLAVGVYCLEDILFEAMPNLGKFRYRYHNGTTTSLVDIATTPASGDVIKIEADHDSGSVFDARFYINGVEKASVQHTVTIGFCGMAHGLIGTPTFSSTPVELDNYSYTTT